MKILAIDTSTRSGGVAILEGDSLVSSVFEGRDSVQEMPPPHPSDEFSSKLFRYVASVLEKARIALPEVDLFAVTSGPGSFTGLRVGLAAVKGWSEVYGRPIAAISGLEAIAAQAKATTGRIVPFTDARRGQVYGAVFERQSGGLRSISAEVGARPEDFLDSIVKINSDIQMASEIPIAFVSPAPEILREIIAGSSLRDSTVEKVSEDLAPWVGRLAFGKAQRGELVDALTLDANYVRRMDVEMYWKDS